MLVEHQHYRTIWLKSDDARVVQVIDQTRLPHAFEILDLTNLTEACLAIRNMTVRGAGLIGACAAFGMYLATLEATDQDFASHMAQAGARLKATRPTAANLAWAVDRMLRVITITASVDTARHMARNEAQAIADEDVDHCRRIGAHGLALIEGIAQSKPGQPVNILTHCNAGWLAFVDIGSATAPIYAAHDAGIPLHIWVDETRPRNRVPMVVALPSSTFDFEMRDGVENIPIEERGSEEVRWMNGRTESGALESVRICPEATPARNWGFDVTPARLISKLICERGVCDANEAAILALFPEHT